MQIQILVESPIYMVQWTLSITLNKVWYLIRGLLESRDNHILKIWKSLKLSLRKISTHKFKSVLLLLGFYCWQVFCSQLLYLAGYWLMSDLNHWQETHGGTLSYRYFHYLFFFSNKEKLRIKVWNYGTFWLQKNLNLFLLVLSTLVFGSFVSFMLVTSLQWIMRFVSVT